MDNYIWWFVIIPLATWRVTHILAVPEKIAEPLHNWVGRKLNSGLLPSARYEWLNYLINCYYCLSVWAGIFCVLIWLVYPYALLPLLASTLTIKLWDNI